MVMSMRLSTRLHNEIAVEQQRLKKLTNIEPSFVEVMRMLIERGLANGKKNTLMAIYMIRICSWGFELNLVRAASHGGGAPDNERRC